jgi:hypothetical protein
MQTPAGRECSYFYGDYYRGRSFEDCRLLSSSTTPLEWKPELCFSCPVPEIGLANACDYMILEPRVERTFPLWKKRVKVNTSCSKSNRKKFDPKVGCGECHILPPIFTGDKT